MKNQAQNFLTNDEIRQLNQRSDWAGFRAVLTTWGIIIAAFILAIAVPGPVSVIIALILLGGRQLALAILMHDASHYSLFKSRALNRFFGQWLAAYPILQNVHRYRDYHLKHHRFTGTQEDPDLPLADKFPVPASVLIRNMIRDLTGIVGFKSILGSILMALGYLQYELNGVVKRESPEFRRQHPVWRLFFQNLAGPILVNLLMWYVLHLFGYGEYYLLWPIAYMTTHMLFLRIRSISEHAMMGDPHDALQNARTTRARWFNRLTVAPHHVNYHLEHHMLMGVPQQNLPKMHQLLVERGAYNETPDHHAGLHANSYGALLKQVVT